MNFQQKVIKFSKMHLSLALEGDGVWKSSKTEVLMAELQMLPSLAKEVPHLVFFITFFTY